MKHLTDEQLSAYLDGALVDAEAAGRHLAACERCREALAGMAASDAALRPALAHDPGEAYFERFADRVGQRIAAGTPARRGGAWDLGSLFRSPRAFAWAGGVAVLVVGGGLALMTIRENAGFGFMSSPARRSTRTPAPPPPPAAPLRDAAPPAGESSSGLVAPPPNASDMPLAPPSNPAPEAGTILSREERRLDGSTPGKEQVKTLAEDDRAAARAQADAKAGVDGFAQEPPPAASTPAPGFARPASPSRAREVRPNQAAEELRASRAGAPTAPSPATGSATGQAGQVHKKTMAQPLDATKQTTSQTARDESTRRAFNLMSPAPAAPFNEAEIRLCGDVLDASGRPVAGAQVAVTDVGRSTTTDARGRYCVIVPRGEHALSVMAVGYRESRQTVRVESADALAHVTLAAVPVLDPGGLARAGRAGQVRAEAEAQAEAKDDYAALSDTVRGMVRTAQRLDADAATRRSAATYDFAAAAWERALRRVMGGPLEIETRRNLAVARYRAWELAPNSRRARAAIGALTAYASRAPAGPERNEAARMLDRVKP